MSEIFDYIDRIFPSIWHVAILIVTTIIVLLAYLDEVRQRMRDQERIAELLSQLHDSRAHQTQLYREKADLELKLRTARHAYIFDLPAHIPGSQSRCPN